MKLYRFLKPLFISNRDFNIDDSVLILQTSNNTHLLIRGCTEIFLTDKQYNEMISKQIIELI